MPEAFRAARDALAFLEAHRLAPVAENYTFALAVVADPGSDLARAVAAETDGGLRLTARALETLSERHLAIKRDTTAERDSAVTARANQLGALTTDAQTLTRSLSHDVSAMASEAENWPDATLLVTRLPMPSASWPSCAATSPGSSPTSARSVRRGTIRCATQPLAR